MLADKTIGFLGCGKISSALCRGYADAPGDARPKRIIVSKRNEAKSMALKEAFPELVQVEDDNAKLVENSDIVFIGLLPGVARSILPNISFEGKYVVSMMAAVTYNEILDLLRLQQTNIIRTVPLPSSSRRCGPILSFPPNNFLEVVLNIVGTPIVFDNEDEMKTAVCVTGQISPFYELLRVTEDWIVKNGVNPDKARPFVSSFYSSLASGAEMSSDTFEELRDEAATPGGLNEQAIKVLRNGSHYKEVEASLEGILRRLKGL